MSALNVNDPEDPRSHRYYAPRQRVFAREATLQPVLERLRGGTRDYSADERLDGDADPVALPETEFIVVPRPRFPLAVVTAFAGGAAATAAVVVAYIAFGTNGILPVTPTAVSVPPVAQAPAKIAARLTPNQPVSQPRPAQPAQVATSNATASVPLDTLKGDRLDASATPATGLSFDPLRSPVSLWGGSPTQAAIEGTAPALAAAGAPTAAAAEIAAAPPPHQAAPEQKPEHHAEHHATPARHRVRIHHHVRHVRHHKPATSGQAASDASGQTATSSGAAKPTAPKKLLGLFGG
jgi:hypothetical protein